MQIQKWLLFLGGLFLTTAIKAQNPSVSFVVDSETISEGIGTFQIAVYINNPNANATSVDINVMPGGTAQNGVNFTYSPVTVTFPGNTVAEQLVTIAVIDDSVPDGNKSVTFSLANPTNGAAIGMYGQSELTMFDVDTPFIAVWPVTQSVNEGIGLVNFYDTLNRGVRGNTVIHARVIADGTTAVPGVDFFFTDSIIIWPPDSDGVQGFSVGIVYNQFYEHARTVKIGLTATNGAVLSDTIVTLTIEENQGFTQPGCSDIFFGQYVQGTGNNQALQVYNPTAVPIDLSVYSILKSVNAGASMTAFNLPDTSIAPFGVYVAANTGAEQGILNIADTASPFFSFDGTDALALLHLTDTIDIIGQLYVNPGASGWAVAGGTSVKHTLIRNYYGHAGDTSWASASPTWNSYPVDMIDSVGFHHSQACNGGSPVATVRFLTSSDTIEQTDTTITSVTAEINNPTGAPISFWVGVNFDSSTAVDGYGNDYDFSNKQDSAPPGISYFTAVPLFIFPSSEISPAKKIVFIFFDLSGNVVAVPDSTYTLYLTNNNKFVVSFLGAGYSYPKGSGLVRIPVITSTFSSQPTSVDVTLSTGSAVLGTDFTFTDTTVTFPAFSTDTQGVWVNIFNNNVYEGNKQANFNLSNATNNAILGITGFTLTIINNDSLAGGVLNAVSEGDIRLFPNPVLDKLFVQSESDLSNVNITDILGNRIANLGKFQTGTSSIEVSSLLPGIYFLNITEGNKNYCRRIVKVE